MTDSSGSFAGVSKPAPEGNRSPELNKDTSPVASQQYNIEYSQKSRPHNVYQYSHQTGFMTPSGRGMPPMALTMSDMSSAIPNLQPHTAVFDQQSMPQHFIPPGPNHAVVYSSIHPVAMYPETATGITMTFNNPYSHPYPHYVQHQQHQNTPIQHSASGYQPLGYTSAAHMGVSTIRYAQGYYTPAAYVASQGQSSVQPTVHLHTHTAPYITQGSPIKESVTPSKDKKAHALKLEYDVSKTIVDGSTPMRSSQTQPSSLGKQTRKGSSTEAMRHTSPLPQNNIIMTSPTSTKAPDSSISRGVPRKPKQSGHALWVGNLPPGTDINELKDYFSRDASKDVESVFLISKSNCAFVNYKSEAACIAALARFHDTRFHGARLVCRLRHGQMSPTPQTDLSGSLNTFSSSQATEDFVGSVNNEKSTNNLARKIAESKNIALQVPSRYFIVKSLTMNDLELSRRSGIWATQAHNEENLNQAYQDADNVYLIFSANKSGEYYGYARMISPIQEDDGLTLEMPPRPNLIHAEPEDLDMTPTLATSTAPNGRIINDFARGAIFWEADSSEEEGGGKLEKTVMDTVEEIVETGFQSIGKPFRIQWLSTERVPFQRTRGLKNPWNANREIKIARDGTEIEPTVGERLVQLFHSPYPG
ncbi:YT521-B-like domain-containing protein [Aspergillus avenaceus]|uniref:YT521-B-like domain-containing protein n=1 Tax=Aspergillus avenaceus TaxID=36643 RepID=A0A5N6TMY6_ASPAV|nr:YT521-B-like domain-containing protein [Aspergillus avenaceus]